MRIKVGLWSECQLRSGHGAKGLLTIADKESMVLMQQQPNPTEEGRDERNLVSREIGMTKVSRQVSQVSVSYEFKGLYIDLVG